MILPPFHAQQRAWEAAYVLAQEFPTRIPKADVERVKAMLHTPPSRIGWVSVCFIHVLFGQLVEERQ